MKVKEAIKRLESDIHTLETQIKDSMGSTFLIRQRILSEKQLILKVYKTVDIESEIIVADFNILITLN